MIRRTCNIIKEEIKHYRTKKRSIIDLPKSLASFCEKLKTEKNWVIKRTCNTVKKVIKEQGKNSVSCINVTKKIKAEHNSEVLKIG